MRKKERESELKEEKMKISCPRKEVKTRRKKAIRNKKKDKIIRKVNDEMIMKEQESE